MIVMAMVLIVLRLRVPVVLLLLMMPMRVLAVAACPGMLRITIAGLCTLSLPSAGYLGVCPALVVNFLWQG